MTNRYTRELLTDTAATVASIDQLLLALGRDPGRSNRKYLCHRLTSYGIDVSHFVPRGTVDTRELLEEAVAVCHSVAGVVRHLHQRQAGGGSRRSESTPHTSPGRRTTGECGPHDAFARTRCSCNGPPMPNACRAPGSARHCSNSVVRTPARTAGPAPSGSGDHSPTRSTTSTGTGRTTGPTTSGCSVRTAMPSRTPTAVGTGVADGPADSEGRLLRALPPVA